MCSSCCNWLADSNWYSTAFCLGKLNQKSSCLKIHKRELTIFISPGEEVIIVFLIVVSVRAHARHDLLLERVLSAPLFCACKLLLNIELPRLHMHHLFKRMESCLNWFYLVVRGSTLILNQSCLLLYLSNQLIEFLILSFNLLLKLIYLVKHVGTRSKSSHGYRLIHFRIGVTHLSACG